MTSVSEPYDHVFVGASPLAILEACHLKASGGRVLVLEKDNVIGGAWQVQRSSRFLSVDRWPHIIQPFPGVYEFFEHVLDLPLKDLTVRSFTITPVPFFGQCTHAYNQWHITEQSSMGSVLHHQATLKRDGARDYEEGLNAAAGHKSNKGQSVKYFRNGVAALIERLQQLVDNFELDVRCSIILNALDDRGGRTSLVTHNGEIINAEHVYLSTNSHFGLMKFANEENTSVKYFQKTLTLTIMIKDANNIKFDLVSFVDHRFIRFISNVTDFANFCEPEKNQGIGTLKVYVRPGILLSKYLAMAIVNELVIFGLMAEPTEVVDVEHEWYVRAKIPSGVQKAISDRLSDRVIITATNNFAEVVSQRADVWETSINSLR